MTIYSFSNIQLVGGIVIFLCTSFILSGQSPNLDVEGDVKIRGYQDIHHPDDTASVYIGLNAGINVPYPTAARNNTFIGTNAGQFNTTGNGNLYAGTLAGRDNTTGFQNVFLGAFAGRDNIDGASNIFVGNAAGRSNTDGEQNVLVGSSSALFNNSGSYNVTLGWGSGLGIVEGSNNTMIGHYTGGNNGTGDHNSYLGKSAGINQNKGSFNTFLGSNSGIAVSVPADSLARSIAIGYNAKVACHNCAVIGGSGVDSVNVGIGTDTPATRLHVEGNTKFAGPMDLTQGDDATSILIGESAGLNGDYTADRYNTFIGYQTGSVNTTGDGNTYIGGAAGIVATGDKNTLIGGGAGFFTSTGDNNTFIGNGAGFFNMDGEKNVFIGVSAEGTNTSIDSSIAIGYYTNVGCNNCAVIGSEDTNFGIGTETPEAIMHAEGNGSGGRPHFIAKESTATGSARMRFMNTNVDTNFWAIGAKPLIDGNGTSASFSIFYKENDAFTNMLEIFGDGDATLAGMLTENSDERLKTNINLLTGVLPKLLQISGYTYNWSDDNRSSNTQIGLMAQEVKNVFPELVNQNENGILSVSYTRFVPLLIEAIHEQDEILEMQKTEIGKLHDENELLKRRIQIIEEALNLK